MRVHELKKNENKIEKKKEKETERGKKEEKKTFCKISTDQSNFWYLSCGTRKRLRRWNL